jgi:hypothetical protein
MFFFSITLTMALDIDPQWCFGSHPKELVLFLHRLLHSAMVGFLIRTSFGSTSGGSRANSGLSRFGVPVLHILSGVATRVELQS